MSSSKKCQKCSRVVCYVVLCLPCTFPCDLVWNSAAKNVTKLKCSTVCEMLWCRVWITLMFSSGNVFNDTQRIDNYRKVIFILQLIGILEFDQVTCTGEILCVVLWKTTPVLFEKVIHLLVIFLLEPKGKDFFLSIYNWNSI